MPAVSSCLKQSRWLGSAWAAAALTGALFALPTTVGAVDRASSTTSGLASDETGVSGLVVTGAAVDGDATVTAQGLQSYLNAIYQSFMTAGTAVVDGQQLTARRVNGQLVLHRADLERIADSISRRYAQAGQDAVAFAGDAGSERDGRLEIHVIRSADDAAERDIATHFFSVGAWNLPGAIGAAARRPPLMLAGPAPDAAAGSSSSDSPAGIELAPGEVAFSGCVLSGVSPHERAHFGQPEIAAYLDSVFSALASGKSLQIGDAVVSARVDKGHLVMRMADVRQIALSVKRSFYDRAYLVAIVYIPKKSIDENGKLRMVVMEGRFGKILVQGNKHYRSSVIARYFKDLPGKPADLHDADHDALRAHDLPGLQLAASLHPGVEAGETDLAIRVTDERRVQGTLGFDNYGTDDTGRYRANAGIQLNDLTGFGEQTSFSFSKLFDPTGSVLGDVSENIPILPMVSVFGEWAHNTLAVDEELFGTASLKAFTDRDDGGVEIKFIRTTPLDISTQTYLEHVRSRVRLLAPIPGEPGKELDANAVDDTVTTLNNQVNIRYLNTNGLLGDGKGKFLDGLTFGIRNGLGRPFGDEFSFYGIDASGLPESTGLRYVVAKLGFAHIQGTLHNQTLILAVHGQYTNDFLPTVEQFSMGGPDSVRAYPVSEILRDRGAVGQLEYRINAPFFADVPAPFAHDYTWGQILAVKAFFDIGYAEDAHRPPGQKLEPERLHGPGGGITINVPRVGRYIGGITGDVTVAYPTSSAVPSDSSSKTPRVYGALTINF